MKILISKLGGAVGSTNVNGESGETEQITRYLMQSGRDVRYFGHVSGDWPCPVITPYMDKRWNDLMSGRLQREGFERDLEQFDGWRPDVFIWVNGYSPTWSRVDNPNGAKIFTAGIRFVGPQIHLASVIRPKIINVNNDPRTYLKDQALTTMYRLWPDVILDQVERTVERTLGGHLVTQKSIYGYCDTWIIANVEPSESRRCGGCLAGHSHFRSGIKDFGRYSEFVRAVTLLNEGELDAWGYGWADVGPWVNHGPATSLSQVFARYSHTIVLTHADGFIPSKAVLAARNGCVPLFLPDGPYAYRTPKINPETTPEFYLGTHDIDAARKSLHLFDAEWSVLEAHLS